MLLLAVLLPLLLCAPRSRKRAKKFSLSAPLVRASNEPWLPKSRRLLPLLMAKVAGLPVLFSRTLLLPPPPPTPTTPPPLLLFVLPGVCSVPMKSQLKPHQSQFPFQLDLNFQIKLESSFPSVELRDGFQNENDTEGEHIDTAENSG